MSELMEQYDENDIEDFDEYLNYYGFDNDNIIDDDSDDEVRELYF